MHALFRVGHDEPGAAVDLGEPIHLTRPRRPFELEFVADNVVRVDFALDREGMDDLAALLLRGRQGHELAVDRLSRFFGELAARGIESIFRAAELALWDRPGAGVLLGPKGSAGMDEENLQP